MIHELAAYEKAPNEVIATPGLLREALFGPDPAVFALMAEDDGTGEVVGFALWFRNFSTWDGVAGIHLEDLFVRERFRRRGLARALLAALARHCVEKNYTRLSWAVLEWNTDAIALYDAVGGRPLREWIAYRLSGAELSSLAGTAPDVSH